MSPIRKGVARCPRIAQSRVSRVENSSRREADNKLNLIQANRKLPFVSSLSKQNNLQ